MQKGYQGSYQRIAPKRFIPQATISAQLEQIGLSEAAMLQTICEMVPKTAKEQPV